MKHHTAITWSVATLSLGLLLPTLSAARTSQPTPEQGSSAGNPPAGEHEAMKMVSAQAALDHTLDSKKVTPGQAFDARLSSTVHLTNGSKLPSGTVLMGNVGTDDMQENGMSKLALRFTQAKLKSGQVIPIKATIVGIFGPDSGASVPYPQTPGDQVPVSWNDGTLAVEQLGVMSGVDLHSKISSNNSGVLVSTKRDDIKLKEGTEFGLAIAERGNGQELPAGGD
jgi:hypothetical protein